MGTEERWAQRMEWEDERRRDPKCGKFPDCSCEYCHKFHVEQSESNSLCEICKEEPAELDHKEQMEIHQKFHMSVENLGRALKKLKSVLKWDKRRFGRLLK